MPKTEQQENLQFVITLVNVKMKVKFPCKMVIEQSGCVLTKETQPSQGGKFVFNQELRLKEDSEKLFSELIVCLITDKGARYTAGSIRLYHNEVLNSEGERLVVTLSKCLDPEALCEVKIEKVVKRGTQRKRTLTSIPEHQKTNSPRLNEEDTMSPRDYKTNKIDHLPINEAKSESYLPSSSNNIPQRKGQHQNKPKDYLPLPINTPTTKRIGNPSPRARRQTMYSKSKYQPFQSQADLERQKAIESDVYKDNYLKLKQKYQRQAEHSKNELSRRMILENNENNFKLELMRYKIKNDELEKSLAERTAKVKELTAVLSTLQGKDSEIIYLREDLSARQHTMRMLQETVVALTRENDELRIANKETAYKFQEKAIHLEGEIDTLNNRFAAKQQELEKQVKILTEALAFKESELTRKNEQLQKENKNINDLQKALQNKLFECDSLLQTERNNSKQRADQSKAKIEQFNQVILKLNQEKNDIEGERQKLKTIILKNQYEIRLYQQETTNLKLQLEELKTIREKYNELSKEMKIITEQKLVLSKNHERIMLSKESSIEEIAAQYKKEIQYQKKTAKDLEEKNKVATTKLIEIQGQLDLTKGSLEKMKKSHQTLNKEYAELKEKEKSIKRNLKSKEEQCEDAKKEMQRIKEKHQSINDSIKAQNSKQREQIIRLKKQIQHEAAKNDDLTATNGDLAIQMARIKITLQLSQEKYEKLTISAQQKYAQFEKIIKQHQGIINLLQEKIKNQKGNQKEYFAKIQKTDQQIFMISEKNEKASKELRTLQERNKQLETNLKNKQNQLTESIRKINELQLKNNALQERETKLKESVQSSKNELEKSQKIIDILQRDYQRAKAEILNYSLKLGQKQRQVDQQAQLIRKDKQSIVNLQNKLSSTKKELEKFKQSVAEALNSSFVQATSSFMAQKNENYKAVSSIERFNSKLSALRGNADFSNELALANLISQAGKQSNGQISKLNDRVKQLERDIQTTKTELERTLQASKRQKQQASHTIKQLQNELILLRDQKGETEGQLQSQIYELQSQIRQLSKDCEELQENKTELEDTLFSLKAQLQSTNEELVKRIRQHKKECNEYVERLQEQSHHYEIAEKKIHDLQEKIKETDNSLAMEKAYCYKQQQHGQKLEEEKQKWASQAESLKKQVKNLEEKYYQLQIQLLTTNEIKQKYQSMLCQEQSKLKDVRFFNSNILKEKEEIIRKELSLNIQITNLENDIADLQHKLQQEEGSKNKYKTDCEEAKEQNRKLSQQIKELQGVIASQRQKYNEIRDRIRQKQAILNETREEALSLQKKIEESALKNKNLIEQLRQQNDMLSKQLETITIQSNQTTRILEGKLAKANQQLQTAKEQMGELEESIFVERENNHAMVESINKLKAELQEHKSKMEEAELNYKQVLEENKEKDEYMFEMGGKIYELENRIKEADQEKQREIEELNTNLNVKYDEDYQQLYQKIEFIEKERQYFKQKCQEKDEIIAKKNEELRQKTTQQAEIKKSHDSKVKKLEDEKIAIFSDKNKEIARFVDENKTQFQAIRAKQAQIRKVVHQLQISRTTIQKLQSKIKDMQNEKSNQLKSLQNQMENLRRKELTFKSYKDLVRTNQWSCERQVRKIIQSFIKKMLQLSDKQARNDNLISLIKNVEEGLLTMISAIAKE